MHPHEGKRVRHPNDPAIYLVLDGVRRHIPNPETYHNLFDAWGDVYESAEYDSISIGPPLSNGACIVRVVASGVCIGCSDDPTLYLSTNGQLRKIVGEGLARYGFSINRVREHVGPWTPGPDLR